MTEINVERKGRGPWVPILLIVAAALLVWAVLAMWDRDEMETGVAEAPVGVPSVPAPEIAPTTGAVETPSGAVAGFLTFSEAPVGSPVGPGHEYTADGIRRLAAALDEIVEQKRVAGTEVGERLAAFRQKAERIQADAQAMGHADRVRDIFTSAADLMSAVQEDRWPDAADLRDRIAEAQKSAGAIDAGRPLLDQTEAVKAFFDRAAVVVRAMSERG